MIYARLKKNDAILMNKKKLIYLILLIISIVFLISFSIQVNAVVGDLILDTRILFSYPDPHEATTLGTTVLKEGYSISLDDVYDICCQDRTAVGLTIYKNEDIVKTIKVKTGDYIYYNKTIGGNEYTIIESKFDVHFLGVGDNIVQLRPFYQYSDGSNIIEPDFLNTNLNPKTMEAPYEEWNRSFGGIYDDNVWSFQRTSDDGYILGGTIKSQNPEGPPMYVDIPLLIKVDANGNEIWNKTFGDFGYTSSVLDLPDGGNIFVAMKSFEMPALYTSDGGFILAGNSRLIKTDSKGKEQWSKTIRLFEKDGFYTTSSVQETPDGGYILTGEEAWISKIDPNGTEQWSRTFGGAGYDSLNSVRNTMDGGYIFAGRTGRNGTRSDAWILKTDATGNKQWEKTFGLGGFDSVNSVVQTPDGGFVLAGMIDTSKNPDHKGQILYEDHDAWLFKIDTTGNIEWSKTIGGLKRDEAKFVQQAPDGGFVISGTSESYGSGGSDIWLIKVADVKRNTTEKISWNLTFPLYFNLTSNPSGADVYITKYSPELCGPAPHKPGFDLIGKTPLTYKYEYNETFLPFSGLFSLFSFNSTGYEDESKCINIYGSQSSGISVSIVQNGFEPVPKTNLTYNIVAKLKPSKKIKNEAGFEIFLALSILLAVYSIRGRKND